MPEPPLKIMMNVGNPDRAFDFCQIPNAGVGLARLEFIINRMIGVHPKALLEFDTLDDETRRQVERKMAGYADPVSYYVNRLAEGIARSQRPSRPPRSSCACPTSSPTNTPT